MKTYKTINIDGMKFDMEITMYDTTNYATVTLENGNYREDFIWYYLLESLTEKLEEVRHEIAEDYEYFAINYYQG